MYKKKLFNYITIICAISLIGMSLYSLKTKKDYILCSIMLVITLVCNYYSNRLNEKDIDLTKEDKDMLEKLEKEIKNKKKQNNNNYEKKEK